MCPNGCWFGSMGLGKVTTSGGSSYDGYTTNVGDPWEEQRYS